MSMSTSVYTAGAVLAEGGKSIVCGRLGESGGHKTDKLAIFGFF